MLAAGLGTATANTLAQAYPSRLIRIVVAFSPGGVPDILARVLAKEMQGSLGQSVVVDNRPGGGGVIGADAVAKAPTDGYTVILITSNHIITPPALSSSLRPIKDFAAVATLVSTEQVLVLHPSVAANNLQELIALAKLKPGQFNYASAGSAGVPHLLGEMFNILARTRMTHVPYKGSAPAIADLMVAHVQMFITQTLNSLNLQSLAGL